MTQIFWMAIWWFVKKLNVLLPYHPAIAFFGIYPKVVKNVYPLKNLYMGVYRSFIHNCQILEATIMPFNGWMDKLWHTQTQIILSSKRKWAVEPWKDMRTLICIFLSEGIQFQNPEHHWSQLNNILEKAKHGDSK